MPSPHSPMQDLPSPTLLVSEDRTRRNIGRMADRARRHGLAFCPHLKTHQSARVSGWLRDAGATAASVTSLRMARAAAAWGWTDLTIAMPVNPNQFAELRELAGRVRLTVFLVDADVARRLAAAVPEPLAYYVELDAGYGRSGVAIDDLAAVRRIVAAAGHHRWRGGYVHSGHTYDAAGPADLTAVHQALLGRIATFRAALGPEYAGLEIAVGDTPACSTQEDFTGVTSLGPGNFVYYDLVQAELGSCRPEDIAVCAALPVVQTKPATGEVIVHGGWVQLGKDRMSNGDYGVAVPLTETGWRGGGGTGRVTKLSQEHGTLRLPPAWVADLRPGDFVGVLPVHACALVHGMRAVGPTRYLDDFGE